MKGGGKMATILLKGGRVIDPANNFDSIADVLVKNGKIVRIGNIRLKKEFEIIDCRSKIVCPGLIDMHVHARTPGQTHKETFLTLSLAAISGGFTTLACMANTDPVIDDVHGLLKVQVQMKTVDQINLLQVSALTKGLAGHELVNLGAMKTVGAIAFSDDGKGIQNPYIFTSAMEICKKLEMPMLLHCQDERFSIDDPMAEYVYINFALKLAQKIKCPIHIQHVSCAESVRLIDEAKERGLRVTCETAPHYLSLTEKDFRKIGVNAKMNPPLRTENDREIVITGLADGTIDVIATDHAPHSPEEKAQGIKNAPFGVIGLETAVPVVFTTLSKNMPLEEIIRKMTINPARILRLKGKGTLQPGSAADITVIDPQMRKKVEADKFQSLSRNCPWAGKRLQGWPVMTMVAGQILMENGKFTI
jgi:dihydroorotase